MRLEEVAVFTSNDSVLLTLMSKPVEKERSAWSAYSAYQSAFERGVQRHPTIRLGRLGVPWL